MKTETIEWFTPQEMLTKHKQPLLLKHSWGVEPGYYSEQYKEWFGGRMDATPLYWAYRPDGPQ